MATGFGHLPLRFEENRGQFSSQARYVARQGGLLLSLSDAGAVMTLRKADSGSATILRLQVHGAAAASRLEARDPLQTRSNYFVGRDRKKWRTGVPNFAAVAYRGVRPGVDLVYHGSTSGRLEYDFVVAPGASPDVTLDVEGADGLRVASDGALEISTPGGVLRQAAPTVYQDVDGERRARTGRYQLVDRARVGFAVADYDRSRPLVIDPVLVYSTYLGGSGDEFVEYQHPVAVDGAGSIYVVGYTTSANFPTAGALDAALGGAYDAFVAKLTPAGDALEYSTYLGGSSTDYAEDVAVDGSGDAIVVGTTASTDFPTANAIQGTPASGTNPFDVFVTKLAPGGDAILYSTYLGGNLADQAKCVAVDAAGAAYVAGFTDSTNFPTAGPLQATSAGNSDGFVAKLDPSGKPLVYSTYLGGSSNEEVRGIAVDASGAAYLTGVTQSNNFPTVTPIQATRGGDPGILYYDMFVAKLTPAGDALAYSTYLGGSSDDYAYAVAVDASGAAYVAGQALSADFPTANPFQAMGSGNDAIVAKLKPDGSALEYSTYLGGSKASWAFGIAVDARGAAYVAGGTLATDFPVSSDASQGSNAGDYDGFVTKLTPSGTALAYSTYLGGAGWDNAFGIAVDAKGAAYLSGVTRSTDFPTLGPVQATAGGSDDTFVAKIAYPPLVATPASPTVPPRGSLTFVASGGTGSGYTWTLTTNASGGSVDANGQYTAGPTGSVTDVLTLADSANLVPTTIIITVTAGVSITPPSAMVQSGQPVAFGAVGGSGSGFVWNLSTNVSSGTIDSASGAYVAGATGGTEVVHVVDSLGNSADATVTVTEAAPVDAASSDSPDLADAIPADASSPIPTDASAAPDASQGHGSPAGCGCQLGGAAPPPSAALLIVLLLARGVLRRRRHKARPQ